MFPPELARRLGEAADAGAAARRHRRPLDRRARGRRVLARAQPRRADRSRPTTITDDLRATTVRLGPALPQIAALLGVEIPAGAPPAQAAAAEPPPDAKRRPAQAGRRSPTTSRRRQGPSRQPNAPAKPAEAAKTADTRRVDEARRTGRARSRVDHAGPTELTSQPSRPRPAQPVEPAAESTTARRDQPTAPAQPTPSTTPAQPVEPAAESTRRPNRSSRSRVDHAGPTGRAVAESTRRPDRPSPQPSRRSPPGR